MGDEKRYIESIRNRQLNSDKEFVLDSLTGAIDRLQKAFPRYGSFLMEFVQNADDAKANILRIELRESGVRIGNDGKAFTENDVKSICKVGRSSKTPKDYIGYLGVGFKSSFLITDSPKIWSGGFRFKFDKSFWEESEHIPWQVIPIWIDEADESESSQGWTSFDLPSKSPELMDGLKIEITAGQLNSRILLFLRNINEIKVKDTASQLERNIIKFNPPPPNAEGYEVCHIQEYENDKTVADDRWLVFRYTSDVPEEVKQDYVTREWERENVDKREVVVAFKLDQELELKKEEKGTAHIGVFSFLPLKEIPSGLNFLIQADFLTTPGRGELARDCRWNDWLASELYKLIIEKCIPTFLKNDKWKMRVTDILYTAEGGHGLFERFIKEPLSNYLKSEPLLIDEDGMPAHRENLIEIEPELRQFISDEDLRIVYPGKKFMHPECRTNFKLKPEKSASDLHQFLISSVSRPLLKEKAKIKNIAWFKNIYKALLEKYERWGFFREKYYQYNVEHDKFWDRMRDFSNPIILTEDYRLSKINTSFTNTNKINIPEEIKDQFNIVHPELAKDDSFKLFQRKLNEDRDYYVQPSTKVLPDLTEADIRNILSRKAAAELNPEEWNSLTRGDKIEKIQRLKEVWAAKAVTLEDYSFLTLPDKKGIWKFPEELVFPKEYNPEHNLEDIQGKGLLDPTLDFLTTDFVEGEEESKTRVWARFFKELGVDKKLSEKEFTKTIVQRIGILAALKYEKKEGRRARELPRSEEIGGYDIISEYEDEGTGRIQSEDRYIEVKGRRQPNPDIFLTTHQLAALSQQQEKYFIYVVKDALRYPTLCVSRGDRILDITDKKIIIPYAKWSTEAKDDEYQP